MMYVQKLIQQIGFLPRYLITDWREKDFIRHNKAVWKNFQSDESEKEILVESQGVGSSSIAYSYLTNLLARKCGARIKRYEVSEKSLKTKITHRKIDKVFKSFNVEFVSYFELTKAQVSETEKLFDEIHLSFKKKKMSRIYRLEGYGLEICFMTLI